jgi:hypothetical protein
MTIFHNPTTTERVVSPLSVSMRVIIEIVKNIGVMVPAISKLRTKIGRTALQAAPDQLQRYVFDLVNSIMNYGGDIADKSILEIGPGDILVTGIAFLPAGAKSYTAIDRFPSDYASDVARRWYRLVAENWPYG